MANIFTKKSSASELTADTLSSGGKISSFFKKLFFGDKAYLWLCFGIPVAVMYLIYIALGIHPFGEASVLVLDLNAQYVYFYEALREFIHGDQSLLYSFSRQLGGEFMGIYAYYLASPLSYIVALFPKGKMLEALLSIFLLKTGLCGITFGYYLHKTTADKDRKKVNIVAFSIMYALCSYAIVQQNNSMWIDALIWLPLLTYAIEQLITHRKFKLYVISLAVTVMSNYYIGYMVCIYVALYFFYYYVAKSDNGENNPLGEKTHFAKTLLRMIVYSILSLGIAAVILFTAYYSLTFGKTTFSDPSWKFAVKADMMDLLTKFLPGSYDTVRRLGMPFVYCGVLTLFMLPVYFISAKVSNREKIMSGVIISVFMLSFMINVVDLVWHGFQEPNWINYRYSFMLSFLMLVFAHKGFNDIENISGKVHLTTAAFITMFLVVAQKYTFKANNSEEGAPLDFIQTILFTFVCLALYLIILGVYKKAINKQSIAIVMVLIISIEMFANGISNVAGLANDVVYSSYSSYNDYIDNIRPIVDKVQESDTSFYRMEKINHRTTNDNMALNIRGLSNSSSTLNRETVEVLRHMGYFSAYHKSQYYGGNPVSDSLLGLRYVIADTEESDPDAMTEKDHNKELFERYYQLYTSTDKYNAYYNPHALSIAYGVSDSVFEYSFKGEDKKDVNLDPYQNLNEMISAMLGSEKIIEVFEPVSVINRATSNCDTGSADHHYHYSPKDTDSVATVTYSFTAYRDGDVYFYIPSLYQRKTELEVEGVKEYGFFYEDDTPRGFYIGYFEEGEEVSVKMKLTSGVLYIKMDAPAFYCLDTEVFKECIDELSKTQLTVNEDYSEDHIKGTIKTLQSSQTIMTTIPYDEGWRVKVDGKEVDISKTFDAFVSFEIADEGEHTVELVYRSDAFVYGTVCSIICLTVFILLIVFEKPVYAFIYRKLYDEGEEDDEDDSEDECEEDIVEDQSQTITDGD